MSFTSQELTEAGVSALDHHIRTKPVDNVSYQHPALRKFRQHQKRFPGGKQYVDERVRKSLDSNYQFYRGEQAVTYNRRHTLAQAQWEWTSAHDGFYLDEDRLSQHGIILDDNAKPRNASNSEILQLTNLFDEQMDVLREGWEEAYELAILRDGSAGSEDVVGLDAIVQTVAVATQQASATARGGLVPSTEVDHNGNKYWYNQAQLDIAQANLIETMEQEWRKCSRHTTPPDCILAGQTFIDTFRKAAKTDIDRWTDTRGRELQGLDPSVTGLMFHGVPITWVPAFEELDNQDAPSQEWESRAYFLNSKHVKLRPMEGQEMKTRKPPRAYNRYVHYFGLTEKFVMTANMLRCHGVITVTGS